MIESQPPVDFLFFENNLNEEIIHYVIEDEYNLLGKKKKSVLYKQDAQIKGRICAIELFEEMKNTNNQPFGFSWENINYIKEYTYYNYVPFDGKEPKNILELEEIAIDSSVAEWINQLVESDDLQLKEYTIEEIIGETMILVAYNFYNIFIKDLFKNEHNIEIVEAESDFDLRLLKALEYTEIVLNNYLNNDDIVNIFNNHRQDFIEYYSDFI